MGAEQSIEPQKSFAKFLPGETAEDSSILRHPETPHSFILTLGEGLDTMDKSMNHFFSCHSSLPMLGTRKENQFIWKTYKEVEELCRSFGSGLMHLNLCPLEQHDGYSARFISVYSINRAEWNIADIGSLFYGIANVPFYDSLSAEGIQYILEQTGIRTAVLSGDKIKKCCEMKRNNQASQLLTIISMDELSAETRTDCLSSGLQVFDFSEIISIGREHPQPVPPPAQPLDLYSLSYTSGTTGNPKGVIITHQSMVSSLAYIHKLINPTQDDSYLSYLPAAHIYEKVMSNMFYITGGKIGFYSGDPLKLREDFCVLKPTIMVCVPRILNRFTDLINSVIYSEPEQKRIFIENMIREKLEIMKEKSTLKHALYDFLYFRKFKKLFGGRIRLGMTAAAPMNGQVLDRLKVVLGVNFINAYGQTEIAGAATCSHPLDFEAGHVGGPATCLEIKLVDIPEMGYGKDNVDQNGEPAPTGEICFRGASVLPKYFKNSAATEESFDSLGWLHTGDVGLIRKNGTISVIDRKKSLLKLSQGEYVSPEKIENVYMQSKYVSFNYVYGNSLQSYLVAIVVPDKMFVEPETKRLGLEDWVSACEDDRIKSLVLEDIHQTGRRLGLNSIEQVKRIHLLPYPITPDMGLLTPTFKMKRKELRDFFGDILESLYLHHR